MGDEDSIIIDVDIDVDAVSAKLSETIQRIAVLREEQKELSKTIKAGNDVNGAAAAQYARNAAEIDRLNAQQREYTGTIQRASGVFENYGDSLYAMRRKLSDMQKAYDSMSAAERESASGKEFLAKIKEQNAAVQELEMSTGRHQRNVGNYPKIITAIVPGFEKVNGVLSQMGVNLEMLATEGTGALRNISNAVSNFGKLFITPPIVIIATVLAGVALILSKLQEAFRKNDDASTKLAVAFSKLQPILTAVGDLFSRLANIVADVVVKLASVAGTVASAAAALFGLSGAYNAGAEGAENLVLATDKLEDAERAYTENSAKRNAEIADLRAKAADRERYSASERAKMLQEAIELEKANLSDERAIAAERLRILEQTALQENDTSDETKNKIAEARAAMYQAEEAYSSGTRRLISELNNARKQDAADIAARAKEVADARAAEQAAAEQAAAEQAAAEQRKAEVLKAINQELQDALVAQIADANDRAMAQEQLRTERELAELHARRDALSESEIESRDALNSLIELKEQEHQQRMRELAQAAWEADREQAAGQAAIGAESDLEKAEAEYQATTERLTALRELDDEDKALLFSSEEEYLAALDAAQQNQMQASAKYDAESVKSAEKAAEDRRKVATRNAQAIASVMGGLTQVLDEFAEQNKDAAKASKAIALGQIAVQTGIAIAEGMAAANVMGFPANIAAIATTVATVMANIASAISTVKSAKFAEGGVVGGTSYTGDKIMAYLNSGEVVLNKDQAAQTLYAIANGSVGVADREEALTLALSSALSEMPAPVLEYQEYKTFENNVVQIREFAQI